MAELYAFNESQVRKIVESVLYTKSLTRNDPPSQPKPQDRLTPFGIVRGKTTSNILSTTQTFTIDEVEPLGQSSPHPGDSIRVVNIPQTTFSEGDVVYAIYNYAVVFGTDQTGTGTGLGNWEVLEISPGGRTGTSSWCMVYGSIPAATVSIVGTVFDVVFGSASNTVALLKLKGDNTGFERSGTLNYIGLWWSLTPFRASTDQPVVAMGEIVGTNRFLLGNGADFRFLPNFLLGSAQVAFHREGQPFELGGRLCAEVGT